MDFGDAIKQRGEREIAARYGDPRAARGSRPSCSGRRSSRRPGTAFIALDTRVQDMVEQMDAEGVGSCSNFGESEAAYPKDISMVIGHLNREYLIGTLYHPHNPRGGMLPQ
jgi:hypothetical protein